MYSALIVDDNRLTADSLARVLTVLGFQVYTAYGPGPGLNLLSSITPDMIFLDINMPGVSGFEILKFVGREPHLEKVPVFICTSDDQPQTKKQALESGASDFLLKPVTVDVLESVLKKANFL